MDTYQDFDVRGYLVSRYPVTLFEEDGEKYMEPWDMLCYHRFYETFRNEWDNSSAVLLQLGGGPCIYDLISAPPYVAEIYHSDYLKCCCDEVLLWKNNDPSAYDWSQFFRYTMNTLEGKDSPHAVIERQNLLRNTMKGSLICDIKQSPIVLPGFVKPPDIICISFCLEVAVASNIKFIDALKEIYGILKPKGFFVMLISLECTWYLLSGIKYSCLYYTEKDIEDALQQVGFVIRFKEAKEKPLPARNRNNDTKSHGFFVAQKV